MNLEGRLLEELCDALGESAAEAKHAAWSLVDVLQFSLQRRLDVLVCVSCVLPCVSWKAE